MGFCQLEMLFLNYIYENASASVLIMNELYNKHIYHWYSYKHIYHIMFYFIKLKPCLDLYVIKPFQVTVTKQYLTVTY